MTGATEDPLTALRRWQEAGGHWRVLGRDPDGGVTVGLFTCDGGEEMGRLRMSAQELEQHGP